MSQTFEAKSERELQQLDVPELVTYFASYTAAMDEDKKDAKKAMEEKEKDAKKAMDDKIEENKNAMDEEHKKDASRMAAVLKAMDEEDPEKRKEAVKSAMEDENKDKDHTAMDMKDDEEKKALKAQVTYLANKTKLPTINYLKQVYTAAKVDDSTLKTYEAEWSEMTPQQLDAAVEKVKPLVESMGITSFEAETEKSPFGFSTLPTPSKVEEFSASKEFQKIDKMTPEQLMNGGIQ